MREVKRAAPTLDLMLWKPVIAEPPVYSQRDLKEWVTLDDVMDAGEVMALREAIRRKAGEG